MKKIGRLLIKSLLFLTIASLDFAQTQQVPRPLSPLDQNSDSKRNPDEPQFFVVCTGWHALCTSSPDCQIVGDNANCDCMRVNEAHIVATDEIQDARVKRLTRAKCTEEHPCEVDQAPVCTAIRNGKYKVDNIKYDWVSTYSYRGWCSLLSQMKVCDPTAEGYTGNTIWAICDAAPCSEIQNPSNPEKPLSCQCRLREGAFVGMNSTCTGENGGIMSSMPTWAWDFENNTYPFPMPGYEFVQGACAPLKSDPPPSQSGKSDR